MSTSSGHVRLVHRHDEKAQVDLEQRQQKKGVAVVLLLAPGPAQSGRGFGGGGFAPGSSPQGGFPQGSPSQGGGGWYGSGGWQGARANGVGAFAADQEHSEDPYVKAASEEEERVLKKLNSICRGYQISDDRTPAEARRPAIRP